MGARWVQDGCKMRGSVRLSHEARTGVRITGLVARGPWRVALPVWGPRGLVVTHEERSRDDEEAGSEKKAVSKLGLSEYLLSDL